MYIATDNSELNLRVPRHEFAMADQALTIGAEQVQSRLGGKFNLSRIDEELIHDSHHASFLAKSMRLAAYAVDIIDQEVVTFELLDKTTKRYEDTYSIDDQDDVAYDYQPVEHDDATGHDFMKIMAQRQQAEAPLGPNSDTYSDRIRPIVEKRLIWIANDRGLMDHIDYALEYAEIDPTQLDIKVEPGPTQLALNGLADMKKSSSLKVRYKAWLALASLNR